MPQVLAVQMDVSQTARLIGRYSQGHATFSASKNYVYTELARQVRDTRLCKLVSLRKKCVSKQVPGMPSQ
jgi:hypothetical protein